MHQTYTKGRWEIRLMLLCLVLLTVFCHVSAQESSSPSNDPDANANLPATDLPDTTTDSVGEMTSPQARTDISPDIPVEQTSPSNDELSSNAGSEIPADETDDAELSSVADSESDSTFTYEPTQTDILETATVEIQFVTPLTDEPTTTTYTTVTDVSTSEPTEATIATANIPLPGHDLDSGPTPNPEATPDDDNLDTIDDEATFDDSAEGSEQAPAGTMSKFNYAGRAYNLKAAVQTAYGRDAAEVSGNMSIVPAVAGVAGGLCGIGIAAASVYMFIHRDKRARIDPADDI